MMRAVLRLVAVATLTLGPVTVTASAQAHGGDESKEGYVLVQQALAHLAHETDQESVDLAMEKVDDALETDDQEGVDVAEVKQAEAALESGDVEAARTLLEDSITEALSGRPRATGYESGTGLIPSTLPGREPLDGGDWLVLGISVAVAALGAWLSIRFRPHENVRALQLLLGTRPADRDGAQ